MCIKEVKSKLCVIELDSCLALASNCTKIEQEFIKNYLLYFLWLSKTIIDFNKDVDPLDKNFEKLTLLKENKCENKDNY